MDNKTHYQLLDVENHATFEEIKKSFRRLAHLYHPDSPGGRGNEELFTALVESYSVLSDPQKRAGYDRTIALKQKVDEVRNKQPKREHKESKKTSEKARPDSPRSENVEQSAPGLNSARFSGKYSRGGLLGMMKRLFTRSSTEIGSEGPGFADRILVALKQRKEKQVTRTLTIDALESIIGTSREISFPPDEDKVIVPIPPEIDHNRILRIKHTGKNGRKHEIRARIKIIPHDYFERRGSNIIVKLPVTLGEYISGTSVKVPTPAGLVKLTIPPLEHGKNKKLRIPGKGVKSPGSIVRGDVIVDTFIVLPEKYPEALANAVKQIESLYDQDPRSCLPEDLGS